MEGKFTEMLIVKLSQANPATNAKINVEINKKNPKS